MSKYLSNLRVIELPDFRAVSSGCCAHEEALNKLFGFLDNYHQCLKKSLYTGDIFMWHEDGNTIWMGPMEDWVTEADLPFFEITEFEGGLYVVSTANEDDPKDREGVGRNMCEWIEESGVFEMDFRPGHVGMGVSIPSKDDRIRRCSVLRNKKFFIQFGYEPISLREVRYDQLQGIWQSAIQGDYRSRGAWGARLLCGHMPRAV